MPTGKMSMFRTKKEVVTVETGTRTGWTQLYGEGDLHYLCDCFMVKLMFIGFVFWFLVCIFFVCVSRCDVVKFGFDHVPHSFRQRPGILMVLPRWPPSGLTTLKDF